MVASPSASVDVFVLNYNGLPLLEKTLKTVLAQTYAAKAVILSDDNSKDGSIARVKEIAGDQIEIRVRNPGTGNVHAHCNVCMKESKANYVALFHADDLYEPTMLEKQVAFLDAHPEVDVVLTAATAIDENDTPLWPIQAPEGLTLPVLDAAQVVKFLARHGNSFFVFPSALYRRTLFNKIEGFRADLKNAGDLEMWLKVLSKGAKIGFINEPLIRYRLAMAQGSSQYERMRFVPAEFFQVMDSYVPKFNLAQDDLSAYEILRSVDQLHIGLNLICKKKDTSVVTQALRTLGRQDKKLVRSSLGGVDRIKLVAVKAALPALKTQAGPMIAGFILEQTDTRSGALMKNALKLKRWIIPT